jgi:D-lactate dehydrogenase (cytochrome)
MEAGVINQELVNAAAAYGYTYAPDPGSGKSATIGGNINSNAGGPHCLAYGVTANHVLGLKVVLPDGEIIETGGPLADTIGYDLTGVLVGSEGTLGIVTEATTRLMRQAETVRTLLVIFETSIEDASEAVSDIIAHGIVPTAMEMMDGMVCRAVEAAVQAGYPENAAGVLLIEVEGLEDGLDDTMAVIEKICRRHNAAEVRHATTDEERTALWTGRKSALGAMGRIAPNYLLEDGVVPRHKLPEIMALVARTATKYNLPIGNFFHAGDGNIHPTILFDRRDEAARTRARQAADEILHACIKVGGTVSGEHGVGTEKQDYLTYLYNQDDLDAMADLKRCFNPDGRLNPGKIFPKSYAHKNPIPAGGSSETRLAARLEALLGADYVRVEPRTPNTIRVEPGSVEEVAAVIRLAGEVGRTVSPVGGNSHRLLGTPTPPPDIQLRSGRLNQIIAHYPSDLTAAFEAGLSPAAANSALAEAGQMLPLDAPLADQATLGGLVAAGPAATGLRRLFYGTVSDMLLGIQFVRADGRIVRRGGMVVKNVAGYDLSRLQYGALGTLGIITRINVKLSPRPEDSQALLVGFAEDQSAQAGQVIRRLLTSQLQPATVALFDAGLARTLGLDHTIHWLLVRFDGRRAAVTRQIADVRGWAAAAGDVEISGWNSSTLAQQWPALTDFSQQATVSTGEALLRLNVPVAEVTESLPRLGSLCREHAAPHTFLADAATGVIWVRLRQQTAPTLAALVSHLRWQWPQTVVTAAEADLKATLNIWGSAPNALSLMQRIRHTFDPRSLLNRGRYLL